MHGSVAGYVCRHTVFYRKRVQQQLKMLTAPAVLTRMHSVDREYHAHIGLYYALEQLGIARSAWAQSAP